MATAIPAHIKAVSLDFANTLYPLRASELELTIQSLHAFLEARMSRIIPYEALRSVYLDIRDRQFSENRSSLLENDFTDRIRQTIASAMMAVGETDPPDEELVAAAEYAYAASFVTTMRCRPDLAGIVERLAARFDGRVAVCSNFIRSDCIRRPLERDGIMPHLAGVVVSCEHGFIKPHSIVFEAVTRMLDVLPDAIVHVGDDWDADVIGAGRAGLSSIYTTEWRNEPDPFYGKEYWPLAEIRDIAELVD